jgi:hypothetical protein
LAPRVASAIASGGIVTSLGILGYLSPIRLIFLSKPNQILNTIFNKFIKTTRKSNFSRHTSTNPMADEELYPGQLSIGERWLRIFKYAIWLPLTLFGACQVFVLIMTIKFTLSYSTGFSPNSPNWPYYKNSAFASCSESNPTHINCTMLHGPLPGSVVPDWITQEGGNFLMNFTYTVQFGGGNSTEYTWCELASCLAGFKVVPSSPLPAAFGYTDLGSWSNLNMLFLLGTWSIRRLLVTPRHFAENCRGQNKIDWCCNIYNLCSFIFWWYTFSTLAHNPRIETISLINWFSTWRIAYMCQYHPFACWFKQEQHQGWQPYAQWLLYIVAMVQWVATCYISWNIRGSGRFDAYQKYSCLEVSHP